MHRPAGQQEKNFWKGSAVGFIPRDITRTSRDKGPSISGTGQSHGMTLRYFWTVLYILMFMSICTEFQHLDTH